MEWLDFHSFRVIFVSAVSACLTVYAVLLLRKAVRLLRERSFSAVLSRAFKEAGGLLKSTHGVFGFEGRFQVELAKRIEDRRLVYAEAFVHCAGVCMSLNAVGLILQDSHEESSTWTTSLQEFLFMIGYVGVMLATIFPRIVNVRTLNWVYSVVMAMLILYLAMGVEQASAESLSTTVLALHMPQTEALSLAVGVMNLRFPLYTFWNAVYATATIYEYIMNDLQDETTSEIVFAVNQTVNFLEKTMVLCCIEYAMVAGVRREFEAVNERNQRGALASLLDIMCDAVVELDADLKVMEHCTALANTLLHGAGRSLTGARLEEFMPEGEDRELFTRFVRAPEPTQPAAAAVFHVRLRDALNNHLRMEFFHVPFLSINGSFHHLVGLREHVDFQEEGGSRLHLEPVLEEFDDPLGQEAGGVASMTLPLQTWDMQVADRQHVAAAAVPASAVQMERSESMSSRSDLSLEDNTMQVDIKVAAGLPIMYASPRFEMKLGEVTRGAGLADWLLPADAKDLETWLIQRADGIFGGARPAAQIEDFGNLLVGHRSSAALQGRASARAVPRLISVLFPDPERQGLDISLPRSRAAYRVSVRIGRRAPADTRMAQGTSAVAQQFSLAEEESSPTSSEPLRGSPKEPGGNEGVIFHTAKMLDYLREVSPPPPPASSEPEKVPNQMVHSL